MKVENGKLKLSKRDTKIGEFVITQEPDHIKVQSTSGIWSIRYSNTLTVARWINIALTEPNGEKLLHDFLAVIFNATCAVPDYDMLSEVNKQSIACIERHGDLYGAKPTITYEEDAHILEELRQEYEAVEEISNINQDELIEENKE